VDSTGAGLIRPLTKADIPAVASMFWRMFKPKNQTVSPAAEAYLESLYLNPDSRDKDIISQVFIGDNGVLNGFIGSLPLRMSIQGRTLRAAICGPLMVEHHASDPLAGARLLRTFLAGPQDLSLSETANETSRLMWTRLRGVVLPSYSLEWVKIFRPAGFAADFAMRYTPLARSLKPLAAPLDRLAGNWGRGHLQEQGGLRATSDEATDFPTLMELIPSFLQHYDLRPDWTGDELRSVLNAAITKSSYGELHSRIVRSGSGTALGAYLYHGGSGRVARILQIFARRGQEDAVLDRLLSHAAQSGAVAVRARIQPNLMAAMMVRKGMFFQRSSTVLHARDEAVLGAFAAGNAFFNGLAGEAWNRLNGDDFR
jgi:hypothetical protein